MAAGQRPCLARQVLVAAAGRGPAWAAGAGGGCPGPVFAHPWATARPSGPVTVRHHWVAGSRASAAARARESVASSGPNPAASPGVADQPSQVNSGSTRCTDPRTGGPAGSGARPGQGPGGRSDSAAGGWPGAGAAAVAAAPRPAVVPGFPERERSSPQAPVRAGSPPAAAPAGPPGPWPAVGSVWLRAPAGPPGLWAPVGSVWLRPLAGRPSAAATVG